MRTNGNGTVYTPKTEGSFEPFMADDVKLVDCAMCGGAMLGPEWKRDHYCKLSEYLKNRLVSELEICSIRALYYLNRPYCPACYKKLLPPTSHRSRYDINNGAVIDPATELHEGAESKATATKLDNPI